MKRARVGVLTAIAGMGLLGLTACGSDSTGSPISGVPERQQQEAGPRANLAAAEVGALGLGITDQEGMTLYMFDKDTAKPPVSNCNDACVQQWPPLLAEGKELTVTGVDEKLVGTVKRKDGTKQVTVNGWPLYKFAKDVAPGDVNGQNVGGTWHVVTPEGKKNATDVAAAQPKQQQQQPPADQPPANPDTSGGSGSDSGYGY
ncbi:MAG: hypothetical protein ABW215_00875 [Kibdelosporangium sp.]